MIPGAMTIAIPRICVGLFIIILMSTLGRIILIGTDLKKPLRGCKKCLIRTLSRMSVLAICTICCGCWPSHNELTKDEVNYEA
jgi:hypothetical protein